MISFFLGMIAGVVLMIMIGIIVEDDREKR